MATIGAEFRSHLGNVGLIGRKPDREAAIKSEKAKIDPLADKIVTAVIGFDIRFDNLTDLLYQ